MSKCKGKTGASLKACREQEKFMSNLNQKDKDFNKGYKAALKKKEQYQNKVRTSLPLAPTQF